MRDPEISKRIEYLRELGFICNDFNSGLQFDEQDEIGDQKNRYFILYNYGGKRDQSKEPYNAIFLGQLPRNFQSGRNEFWKLAAAINGCFRENGIDVKVHFMQARRRGTCAHVRVKRRDGLPVSAEMQSELIGVISRGLLLLPDSTGAIYPGRNYRQEGG